MEILWKNIKRSKRNPRIKKKKESAVKISLDDLNSAKGKISEFEERKIEIS